MFGDLNVLMIFFTTPVVFFVMLAGVFGGLVVGALPGLTSTMAVALLVPITYGMTVELGLCMLVAVYGRLNVVQSALNVVSTPRSFAVHPSIRPFATSRTDLDLTHRKQSQCT